MIDDDREDHPRSRGVYAGVGSGGRGRSGSSPLARGLHIVREAIRDWARIIPARAGFTFAARFPSGTGGDHPRSRGGYAHHIDRLSRSSGSSPLARGLRMWRRRYRIRRQDHPRSRGVYHHGHLTHAAHGGSSPLARGLRLCHIGRERRRRIIPARAGFTSELR